LVACDCAVPRVARPRGGHRPRHPVPTRRSSDLSGKFETGRTTRDTDFRAGASTDPSAVHALQCSRDPEGGPAHEATLRVSGTLEDRKSTRLNSSHVKISYAVFCLKKKRPMRADA